MAVDLFSVIGFAILLWSLLTALAIIGSIAAIFIVRKWKQNEAKKLYLGQCDVALSYPQFANPEGRVDPGAKTLDGKKDAFEQYEWYVARLVYVLDECLTLGPKARWRAVAETQLSNHKHYFGSEYYRNANFLPHYRGRMRKLIEQAGGG